MARFPTQLGNVGAPRTALRGFNPNQPAEAFGAGIGQALQGTGQNLQQASRAFGEREAQKQRYNALIDFTRFQDRSQRALVEMKRNAPPGAPGFTNATEKVLRDEANEFLGTLPPALQDEFRMRVEPVIGSLVNDAFSFQIEAEDNKFRSEFEVELNKSFSTVHEMPELAEQEANRLAVLIEESPLPPQVKQDMIFQSQNALREGQFLGELERGYTTGAFEPLVVATDLPSEAPGFLNAVAGPESAGRYNVRFNASPDGAAFHDFSDHPRIKVRIPEGQGFEKPGEISDAAGRYQFLSSTWDEFAPKAGVTDFSPASQDKVAWELAKARYKGDLVKDLREDPGKVRHALLPTWPGLKSLTDEEFASAMQQEIKIASGEFLPDIMGEDRFDSLPAPTKRRLKNKAESVGEARRKEMQRQFLTEWDNEMSFRRTNGRAPDDTMYTNAEIVQRFPAEEAAMLIAERDRALDDGRLFLSVQSATPAEVEQIMQEAQAAVENPDNHEMDVDRLSRLQRIVADRNKKLMEDAPAYLAQTNPQIADLREQLSQGQGAEAYAEAVLAEQKRLGVPAANQRVLGDAMTAATLRSIEQTEADAKGQAIVALVDQWGEYVQEVLLELEEEGLSPFMYHATLNAQSNPGLAHEIASAAANWKEAKNAVPTEQHDTISDAVRSNFAPFFEVFGAGDWTGNALENMNEMRAVAEAVVMMRVASGSDVSVSTEAQRVYEQMVTNNYHLVDGERVQAFMPKQVGDMILDPARIETAAEGLLAPELVGAMPLASLDIEPGAPEGVNLDLTRRHIEDQGFWVTDSGSEGLTLMIPSGEDSRMAIPVEFEDGTIVRLSFEQLMETNVQDNRLEIQKIIDDLVGRVIGG